MSMPQSVRPAHSAADHQLVVQHMVAHHMERVAAVDPLPHQIGLRQRQPRVAVAHQKTSDASVVHHQEALKQADAGIFVFDVAHVGAVVAQEATQAGGTSRRHRSGSSSPDRPCRRAPD
jgi:hypothetical protein